MHENRSFRGFGSYGDLLVRDRKMYVAPTPFALTEGTTGRKTLIVPEGFPPDPRLEPVGRLVRTEAEKLIVGYSFDLTTNTLTPSSAPNPAAGTEHVFVALRRKGAGPGNVTMTAAGRVEEILEDSEDDD